MSSQLPSWNAAGHRVGTVYLLHFSRPYCHARHYLGFSTRLEQRYDEHLCGRGSALVRAARQAGIVVYVARVWEQVTDAFERRGHRSRWARRICPICKGPRAFRWFRPYADEVEPGSSTKRAPKRRQEPASRRRAHQAADCAAGERT